MRRSIMLGLSTIMLVPTMLIGDGGYSPASARIFLGQCISGESACHRRCLLALNGKEANSSTLYGLKICLNNCDGGFSACLDLAFSNAAGRVSLSPGPSRTPAKNRNFRDVPR